MTFGPIPIIVAVSGHRDLVDGELSAIRQALRGEFSSLRKRYPHSRLQIFNGLAEGADWLAAEIALECQLELVAVLPLPQTEYEKDFSTPEALERFRLLLSKASRIQEAPFNQAYAGSSTRDWHYEALGIYLAQNAQRLYALWDGNTIAPLPGGTADVVQKSLHGITSEDNLLAEPETCQVRHLCCNRKKNPDAYSSQNATQWSPHIDVAADDYWDEIFHSIDDFNKAAIKIDGANCREVAQSRKWLVGGDSYPPVIEIDLQAHAFADALARTKQKRRHRMLWFLSLLIFLSVFFQQVHLGPDMQWYWLAMHIGLGLSAFGGYLLFFSGTHNSETQYMDWRALAEGLRVQTFWRAAGIQESASNYYLSSQRDELNWIRYAMRNVAATSTAFNPSMNLSWIKERWLKDQEEFFLKTAPTKQARRKQWAWISQSLFGIGAITTAALLVSPLLNLAPTISSWSALAAAVIFLMAAVCRNYASLMAYEEDANRYKKMGVLFGRTVQLLEQYEKTNEVIASRKLVLAVGKEALAENGEWLLLHRQRKFEIPT